MNFDQLKKEFLWVVAIGALALRVNSLFSLFDFNDAIEIVIFAPIFEELLKFLAIRAGCRPLVVGFTFQIIETIVVGIPVNLGSFGGGSLNTSKFINSSHWLNGFMYHKLGAKWRNLLIAIGIHMIWNARSYFDTPDDILPTLALTIISMWVLWKMRQK